MFAKILVCSDGSACALHAVRTGAGLAQRFGSSVVLLDVLDPNFPSGGIGGSGLPVSEGSVESIGNTQHEAIQSAAAPLFAAAGITAQYLHEQGHPVGTIVDTAAREGCDVIVLGSHGQSGASSFLFGSVSEGVLRHASCSVLIVQDTEESQSETDFPHLLLASDASENARKATETAVEIAAKFHSTLTVLTVYQEPGLLKEAADAFGELYPQEHEKLVVQALEQSIKNAAAADVACTLRQEKGRPAETILRVAEEEKPSLLVMGHRGLGGFQSLLLGSVSCRVAQHASCAVLVAR